MPVAAVLVDRGRQVCVLTGDWSPVITRNDTVLCVGDRLQLLRWLVNICPDAKICQLHAGEQTTSAAEDYRYRYAISALATRRMFATRDAWLRSGGPEPYVGAPCLEHCVERMSEAAASPPLDGKDYVVFSMNVCRYQGQAEINRMLAVTANEARSRGWYVYASRPNSEFEAEFAVTDPNVIVQSAYGVPHDEFQRIVAGAHLLVGNSSAGIIEAPSLGTQTIDIAPRQNGRPLASSILRVPPGTFDMRACFDAALELGFDFQPYNEVEHPAIKAAQVVMEVEEMIRT